MEQDDNLRKDFFEKKRYPALRTVAGIYIAYAIIIGLIFIIMTIKFLIEEEWITALSILIGGGIVILVLIAFSESIKVFLDIEYNTRRALMSVILEKENRENKRVEKSIVDSVSEKKVEEEISVLVKDSKKVEELNSLISVQKENLFGVGKKAQIIEITTELCESKELAENLLLYYKRNFNKDLLEELKTLTTNYTGIKDYLSQFIELGVVKEEYPHDKI
jgi:Ca2+/Na+ antiporter